MIRINPDLDAAALATDYRSSGRMQIRDFFVEDDAEEIHRILLERTPWWLAYNDGDRIEQLPPQKLANLSSQEKTAILQGIMARARIQYQFLYEYYPLYSKYFTLNEKWIPLFEFYEFINSGLMLEFFRTLTGRPEIRWADGHATLYRSGHFLKYHTDENSQDKRVAAYVFNFTKDWGRDWGGYLQFFNDRYDVEEALRPIFNALNIFSVPADHSVNLVAPYAPGFRFSVTGWLRADEPPGPFERSATVR